MFIPAIAKSAAARWKASPAKAPAQESLVAARAQSPEIAQQRDDRIARLSQIASSEKARALVAAADSSPRSTASQSDVIRGISQERVIGTRDLLDINFLELAIAIARAVGRMQNDNEFGTGFLVGPRLLMTNNHVIEDAQSAANWLFELDYQQNATGDMLPVQTYRVDPTYFFYTSKSLDFTIAGVAPLSDRQVPLSSYPWVKLIDAGGKIETGDPINIIQHPNGGLKQIAFRENQVITVSTAQPDFLDYSTDTEPGSSGSPCFNDQWELVALHHSGVAKTNADGDMLEKNGQPWKDGDDPNSIDWIGNEGARVSAIVRDLKAASFQPAFSNLRDQVLSLNAPNPVELARIAVSGAPTNPAPIVVSADSAGASHTISQPQGVNMPDNSRSFQIPLVVTVSLGGSAPVSAAQVATLSPTPAPDSPRGLETVVIDQDWKSRPGYDPQFLGVKVPLPTLKAAQLSDTAQVLPTYRNAKATYPTNELCYWNYNVLMNKRYRTAWFSAANVDGNERPQLPPRAGDKWFVDPRIDASAQLSQIAFETGIDRGHLTRREDAAWGATVAIATRSTNDTFHFSNCSLQASPFNRGKDRWQGLEQFLLEKHAKPEKRRIVVITGPVFNSGDPTYKNDKMDYSVPCPLQFWKVCVLVKADNSLSSTGFILGQQDIAKLPGFEAFNVGAAQVTLVQLETKTGLDFGILTQYDNFAKTGEVGALEKLIQGSKQRFLHSFDEITI